MPSSDLPHLLVVTPGYRTVGPTRCFLLWERRQNLKFHYLCL